FTLDLQVLSELSIRMGVRRLQKPPEEVNSICPTTLDAELSAATVRLLECLRSPGGDARAKRSAGGYSCSSAPHAYEIFRTDRRQEGCAGDRDECLGISSALVLQRRHSKWGMKARANSIG